MRNNVIFIGLALLAVLMAAMFNQQNELSRESIIYFPIDPKVSFSEAKSTITEFHTGVKNQYSFTWKTASKLGVEAYLRQDVGLLFVNGRLRSILKGWEKDTDLLIQEKQMIAKKSAWIYALTFHYAEVHDRDRIKSAQKMSADQAFIIQSSAGFRFFHHPDSPEERTGRDHLVSQTNRMLTYSWERGFKFFSIDPKKYVSFPLTDLSRNTVSFSGFSATETQAIIGRLWEGLYKNYFLGIKKADGTIENPIGSTIPLILLAKDKTHLLVLGESAKDAPILLRQQIIESVP